MTNNFLKIVKERIKDKAEYVKTSTEKYIKRNPIKSSFIALGIGAAVGSAVSVGICSLINYRRR